MDKRAMSSNRNEVKEEDAASRVSDGGENVSRRSSGWTVSTSGLARSARSACGYGSAVSASSVVLPLDRERVA